MAFVLRVPEITCKPRTAAVGPAFVVEQDDVAPERGRGTDGEGHM